MIVALGNMKGGVGKSSMTGMLAKELSKDKKVIMLDLDQQGNVSDWFLTDDLFKQHDIGDVMNKKVEVEDAIVQVRKNLDIIPCFAIGGELKNWSETEMTRVKNPFHKLFKRLHQLGYNYIVCDTSPSMSALEREIFSAVDEIITVAGAERFSFEGIESFQSHLEEIRENLDGNFNNDKLILNRVNESFGAHKGYMQQLREKEGIKLFVVGQSQSIANAQLKRQFLDEYDSKNKWLPVMAQIGEVI